MTAQVIPLSGAMLTPLEVAERLGPRVNAQRVYRWVKSGKLRAFRPDARGAVLIAEADLRAFIAANTTTSVPQDVSHAHAGSPRPGGNIDDLMPASGRRF